MKIKELNIEFPKECCELCHAHEEATKQIFSTHKIMCPHCKRECIDPHQPYTTTVVGETNGYPDPEQEIELMQLYSCPECGDYSAMKLKPIIYNGNHDVYYTGGKMYLAPRNDGDQLNAEIKERLMPHIEQYTTRLLKGESLEPWNLLTWIQYDVEHIVAEYLAKLKIET